MWEISLLSLGNAAIRSDPGEMRAQNLFISHISPQTRGEIWGTALVERENPKMI
jgi:hypothetical protein